MPMLLDAVDAPLSPYYALLDELRRQVPAMDLGRYIDATDAEVTAADLPPRARRLLEDYRLLQYDLSAGHRYAQRDAFYG